MFDKISKTRKATNIIRDTDNDDEIKTLPKQITIPSHITEDEKISDYLTEITGFCHKGCTLTET